MEKKLNKKEKIYQERKIIKMTNKKYKKMDGKEIEKIYKKKRTKK